MNFIALFVLTTTCCLVPAQPRGWNCSPGRRMSARSDKKQSEEVQQFSTQLLPGSLTQCSQFIGTFPTSFSISPVSAKSWGIQGMCHSIALAGGGGHSYKGGEGATKIPVSNTQPLCPFQRSTSVSWPLLPPGALTLILHLVDGQHSRNLKQAAVVVF